MKDSIAVTNEIRRRSGKAPINPNIIEGFEGGPPLLSQPGSEPIVDLGDDDPPPNAVRLGTVMTARELIQASTPTTTEPGLIILDHAARHGQREVTLSEESLHKITAIVLQEMKRQVSAELKALESITPKQTRQKRKK